MTATLLANPGPDGRRPRVRVTRLPDLMAIPALSSTGDPRPRADGREAAGRAATRYLRVCIEVLNGYRPAGHLRNLGGPAEFADAVTQLRLRRNSRGHFRSLSGPPAPVNRGRATSMPERPNQGPAPDSPPQTTTRSAQAPPSAVPVTPARSRPAGVPASRGQSGPNPAVHLTPFGLTRLVVCEPIDGIAEIVALLSHADATVAVAMRLERRDQIWICTVIQIV